MKRRLDKQTIPLAYIDTGGRLSFDKEAWRQRKNSRSGAEYSVIPFLKSQGVKRLDEVIITRTCRPFWRFISHCAEGSNFCSLFS